MKNRADETEKGLRMSREESGRVFFYCFVRLLSDGFCVFLLLLFG